MKRSEENMMVDKLVLRTKKWFNRFAVALGGFLIFVGIIIIGVFIFILMGDINFNLMELENFQSLFNAVLLFVGLIDLIAGIILWRR
jgi:hypothetical protein